jgi:hypothetical protein
VAAGARLAGACELRSGERRHLLIDTQFLCRGVKSRDRRVDLGLQESWVAIRSLCVSKPLSEQKKI